MKRLLFLAPLVLLAACSTVNQNVSQVCTEVTDKGVVSGSFTPAASTKVLDPNAVEVSPDQLVVTDNNFTAAANDVLVSNCNDGLLRKVTGVSTQFVRGNGVSAQAIRKVYIQTTDAALEDAITSGDASLDFQTLQIGDASLVQSVPGVEAEAITGKIALKNVTLNPAPGVTVTLNGSVTQSIDPTFRLQFANKKVSVFQAGITGTLSSELSAKVTTTGKAAGATSVEKELAKYSLKRAFLVGAVPVIVVIEPRLIAGANAGADKAITVSAGVAPSLTVNLGAKYDGATGKWSSLSSQPAFKASLNPSYSYSAPGGGGGQIYAKLVLDVKFYGVAGPSLEAKPFANLSINAGTPTQASVSGGLAGTGALKAGFKVLGKGLDTEYALPPVSNSQNFTCTTGGCNANP